MIKIKDGISNFMARLGLGGDNLLAKGSFERGKQISRDPDQLAAMYRDNPFVGRAVEIVAEDMISAGIAIKSDLSPDDISLLQKGLQQDGIHQRFGDALKWAALYGGALAVILIDGHDLSTPLDLDDIGKGSFRGLYVLDRWQVTPTSALIEELGPMLGYPAGYRVTLTGPLNNKVIHHSRCIRFVGIELPLRERQAEQYWGASVVERLYERLLAFDSASFGASNLLFKSYLRVIGVKGFRAALAKGGEAEKGLVRTFEMMREMQSNESITLLDSEDQFQTYSWNFGGIYDALQALAEQISAATNGIPLVKLFGQSPKGFSSGESDLQMYGDKIHTAKEDDLRAPYMLACQIEARSRLGRPLPENFDFDFNPLSVPSDLERSQAATADAQAVAALVSAGIMTEAQGLRELRASSERTGRFTCITDEDIAAAEAGMGEPPPPAPQFPVLPQGAP